MNPPYICTMETIKINRPTLKRLRGGAYRLGYRGYNKATAKALQEAKEGVFAGAIDLSSIEAMDKSITRD